MKKILIMSTALCTLALAGCASKDVAAERNKQVTETVDAGLSRLGNRKTVRAGGSQFSDGIFVGASPERNNAALLPSKLQTSGAVRLESRDALTLSEISNRLTEISGIPHVLALGPTGQIRSVGDGPMTAADIVAAPGTIPEASGGAAPAATRPRTAIPQRSNTPSTSDTGDTTEVTMRPNLRGSLSEVLDQVANSFDVEWSFSDGRVMFRDYVTRKYQVSALPGTSSGAMTIGANAITSESTMSTDVWAEVDAALKSMLGEGASMSIGSSTGMITVTAKVSDQNRVAEYIQQMNGIIGQQVSFDVNVFTVTLTEEFSSGVNLNAAMGSPIDVSDLVGNLDETPLNSQDVGPVNIGLLNSNVSVESVVRALSSQGKVSVSTRAGATTSNNRIAPINVIDKIAYLKEVSIEEDDDGTERVERTPGEVETGFQMQLFPRVMNNREIMVNFTVRLSELNQLVMFGEGNDAIQLPEVSTTSFEQQAIIENGQTLVIAGFERERASSDSTKGGSGGLGNKRFASSSPAVKGTPNYNRGRDMGFNKDNTSSTSRVATVLMITPNIINRK